MINKTKTNKVISNTHTQADQSMFEKESEEVKKAF